MKFLKGFRGVIALVVLISLVLSFSVFADTEKRQQYVTFTQNLATANLAYNPALKNAKIIAVQYSANANLTGDTPDIIYGGVSQIQPVLGAFSNTGNTSFIWWPDHEMIVNNSNQFSVNCTNSAAGTITGTLFYEGE